MDKAAPHPLFKLAEIVPDRRRRMLLDYMAVREGGTAQAAGNPEMNPFGVEENRRNLEVALECVDRQRMLPRRLTVEELFR